MNPDTVMKIGVILPSVEVQRTQNLDLAAAARHAEQAGLDGVWHGDHLAVGMPTLDGPIALAVAAAATGRITIGASVLVPAIRPLAWAVKQVASLQYVSGGRLILGVGSGGGPAQWAAAGVAYAERGRRTDAALELLPKLLAGDRVRLTGEPGQPEIEPTPAVTPPPIWVGNASAVALRRAARLGDGWFPSLVSPQEVAAGAGRLAGLAARRPVPVIAIGAAGALGPGVPAREEIASGIAQAYGRPLEQVLPIPITGDPGQAAERVAAYHDAGARHLVMGISGGDWRHQCDLLAETRALLA
ncbi:LLM class flavin-dependent oxidoreductase [Actinomadura sp. DC4]|uniref:LLM class flavin-dependent oxidoreductase n=1 Tax=Actinomadura sp. DC4 TaxID=3055069 RepID=UPI0025B13A2A|nr:LLM class flavin-dependent oxidoreductase [Actinomadura sp. DC4]MDN3358582.1 LLM class flavin-dependent oxidoreductase [Actinomadura sp. DC4]